MRCRVCDQVLPAQAMFCGECGSATRHPAWVYPELTSVPEAAEPIQTPPAVPREEEYVLQFSTGETVTLAGRGLIRRNPIAQTGEHFDALVRIHDPAKSVSKIHLEFGWDDEHLWFTDRFSGNGTVVRRAGGSVERFDPGKRYRVHRGERVDIGEQFFVVR